MNQSSERPIDHKRIKQSMDHTNCKRTVRPLNTQVLHIYFSFVKKLRKFFVTFLIYTLTCDMAGRRNATRAGSAGIIGAFADPDTARRSPGKSRRTPAPIIQTNNALIRDRWGKRLMRGRSRGQRSHPLRATPVVRGSVVAVLAVAAVVIARVKRARLLLPTGEIITRPSMALMSLHDPHANSAFLEGIRGALTGRADATVNQPNLM